jgi:hypothetical protein
MSLGRTLSSNTTGESIDTTFSHFGYKKTQNPRCFAAFGFVFWQILYQG